MKTLKWTCWMALGAMTAAACTGTEADDADRGGYEEGVYRYVLDHNDDLGAPIFGGAHAIVVPTERGKEDAIDSANAASRLNSALKGVYTKYDAQLVAGETDFKVFASTWWSQAGNGIAKKWYDAEPSPTEKYDTMFYPGQEQEVPEVEHWNMADLRKPADERGEKHKHDKLTVAGPATKWEMQNHGLYQTYAHPDSWWGHCNGWASYATAETGSYPQRDVSVKLVDGKITECVGSLAGAEGCITFRMGDIEALMSELYFSDQATFSGRRCNKNPDEVERDEYGRPTDPECRDLNAGSFHIAVTGLLGKGASYLFPTDGLTRPAFVIDHNWDWEVWNFPLTKYQVHEQEEVSEEKANELIGANGSDYKFNAAAVKFVRVKMSYWMVSDGVSDSKMRLRADQRNVSPHETELNYVLELDATDTIIGGEWIKDPSTTWGEDNKKLHPDFMWAAVNHKGWGEQADDEGGNDDNPYVKYSHVKALLNCANDANSCAPADVEPEPEPEPTGATCQDACGGQSADKSCWCDSGCVGYGDCCSDYEAICVGGTDPEPEPEPDPTPAAASCEGHCGESGAVTGSDPKCYCDSLCDSYGDCCSDYSTVCTG